MIYSIKKRRADMSDTHQVVSATIIPTVNLRRLEIENSLPEEKIACIIAL